MADIVKATRQYLLAKSAVTDLIVARIYPNHLPQDPTLPAIVLDEVSGNSEAHLQGLSGLGHSRLRVKAYGATREAAEQLREAVRVCGLCNYRGTTDSVLFSGVTIEGLGTGADPPVGGNHVFRWYLWLDFMISYGEAAA